MAIYSHDTVQDAEQRDDQRRLRYRYVFEEGPIEIYGPLTVGLAFDDNADRTAKVPEIEENYKLGEQFDAESAAIAGEDFHEVAQSLLFNTTAEAAEFILKRMSNRFQKITKQNIVNELPVLLLLRNIWQELTDQQIANFMGESEADVATWRASFETMEIGVTDYRSPFPIYDDVPPV